MLTTSFTCGLIFSLTRKHDKKETKMENDKDIPSIHNLEYNQCSDSELIRLAAQSNSKITRELAHRLQESLRAEDVLREGIKRMRAAIDRANTDVEDEHLDKAYAECYDGICIFNGFPPYDTTRPLHGFKSYKYYEDLVNRYGQSIVDKCSKAAQEAHKDVQG